MKNFCWARTLVLGLALVILAPAVGFTQTIDTPPAIPESTSVVNSANWSGFLSSSEQAIHRRGLSDNELELLSKDATLVEDSALNLISEKSGELQKLRQQLDELGPAPKEGDPPESPALVEQRKGLESAFAALDADIKDARLAVVRAQQLKSDISQKRRDRFVKSISTRTHNILNITFWENFILGFRGLGKSFYLMVKDSSAIFQKRLSENPGNGLLVLAACIVGFFAYRYVNRKTRSVVQFAQASPLESDSRKAIGAAAMFVNGSLLPAIAVLILYYLFSSLGLLTIKMDRFLWLSVLAIITLIFSLGLARIFLAPNAPENRIADLSDSAARAVFHLAMTSVGIVTFLWVLIDTATVLVSPFQVSIGLSVILISVTVFAAVNILLITSRDRIDRVAQSSPNIRFISWLYIKPLLWIASVIALVAMVFSYIAFAEFLALQILIGSLLLAFLWLTLEVIDALKFALLSDERRPQNISRALGMQAGRVRQVSVLGFGLAKMTIILLGAIAIMLPWGFRTTEWFEWINRAFFGFQVGGLSISMSTIFLAFALFLIGYGVTKAIQSWLSTQFLPTTKIDAGLRNSISTVLGYVGIVIAAMLAVSAAGLDLTSLAFVAGALSLGVGFGLQSIVNNFVSGLILLAERPIKSGDWIITSGGEGTVRKISVRSTEIETFDRATIIVPNSTLISDSVTNWTHTSKFGRINLVIGVGYDSDPDQVKQILLDCMAAHEEILKKPEPSVFFTDFGADALIFDVRGFLSNIENGFGTKSDLRFAILKALREAGIEIPFGQRDIHIRSIEPEIPIKTLTQPSRRPRTAKK